MKTLRSTSGRPQTQRRRCGLLTLWVAICLALPMGLSGVGCTQGEVKTSQIVGRDGGTQENLATQTPSSPQVAGTFPTDTPPLRAQRIQRALKIPQEFFGLYVLGKRAGDMWVKSEVREQNGEAVFVTTSETSLTVSLGAKAARRQVTSQRVYRVGGKGELLSFSEIQLGDGGEFQTTGTCSPESISVVVSKVKGTSQVQQEEKKAPASAETLDDALAPFEVLETGKTYEGRNFSAGDDLRDKSFILRQVPQEGAQQEEGGEADVFVLSRRDEDSRMETVSKVDADGRTLEVRYGDVLTAKAEPQQMLGKTEKLEVFASTKVVLGGPEARLTEKDRTAPSQVIFRIAGLPDEFIHTMPDRQIASKADDGATLLTVKALYPITKSSKLPLPPQVAGMVGEKIDLEKWLTPSISVDSDNPNIVALGRKVVGTEKDALLAAKKLSNFVYDFLEKGYGVSSDRASLVLEMKKGDCTEHALLFTALARAVGIPARRLNGLVYMDAKDGIPALYWHEWAEVFVGQQWISMDPTFGQTVADSGHIAFGDESQRDVAALFGQLKIDVLSVTHPGKN